MIVKISSFEGRDIPKPSDEVDPKYKETPEYALEWSKFIYSQWMNGYTGIKCNEQDKIKLLREYAAGRQSPDIYRQLLAPEAKGPKFIGDNQYDSLLKHGETMLSVDFSKIFSPIPKILLNIQGIMEDTEHDIVVNAMDEKSTSLKSQIKWQKFVDGAFKPFFDYINTTQGLPTKEDVLPTTLEEMDLMQKIGSFKLAYEIGMQDALIETTNISKNKKIKRSIISDLFTLGKAVVMCFTDLGGITKYRYVDIADFIIQESTEEDHSDANWGGPVIWMTISDIRARRPDLNEKLLEGLAKQWGRTTSTTLYATETRTGSFYYDSYRVPVGHFFWKSVDQQYQTKHTDGRTYNESWGREYDLTGKLVKFNTPRMYDTEYRKTSVHERRNLYCTKYIIGSEIVFDNGPVDEIPFDYAEKDVRLPFMVFKIQGKPICETMLPIEDQIQLTYLELQNARAKAAPSGLKIEISSIENVKIGKKTLHPLDVIKIRTQTGHMLYRLAPPEPGNPIGSQNPIEELLGGYEPAILSAVKSLELFYQEMERVSGISDMATGKSPQGEQGLGVTQIALDTTNNTLRPLYTGWVTLKEGALRYCAVKIQSHIINATVESPYYEMLGPAKFFAIQGAGKYPPAYWGIEVQAKLDNVTKQAVMQSAQASLAVGKDGVPILTYSEYLFIVDKLNSGSNVAYIRAYIAYKERKAQEASAQQANNSQMLTIKGKQDSDKQAAQLEVQKETVLSQLRTKEDDNATENKAKLLALEYALKERLALNQIKTQADVDNGQLPSGNAVPPPVGTPPVQSPVQPGSGQPVPGVSSPQGRPVGEPSVNPNLSNLGAGEQDQNIQSA